jgi:hypothetical protein
MNAHRLLLVGVIVMALFLSSCSRVAVIGSCSTDKVQDYGALISRQLDEYDAQLDLAGSTGRGSLSAPRQRLIDLRFETADIAYPDCLADFHTSVIDTMMIYEAAFEAFVSQESDLTVGNLFTRAGTEMGYVRQNLMLVELDIIPIYE